MGFEICINVKGSMAALLQVQWNWTIRKKKGVTCNGIANCLHTGNGPECRAEKELANKIESSMLEAGGLGFDRTIARQEGKGGFS